MEYRECTSCRKLTDPAELENNAQYVTYNPSGKEEICDPCAEKIDDAIDAQQEKCDAATCSSDCSC